MATSKVPVRMMPPAPVIGIVGVTITGNMGGQAMLEAARQQLLKYYPQARIRLFSIYGKQDQQSQQRRDLEVIDTPPARMVLLDLPAGLMMMAAHAIAGQRTASLLSTSTIRKIGECDAIIDLAGIAFASGRGLPLLAYNLACCVPSFATRTPHFKLSQALGPFASPLYRTIGRWALKKCALVVARGDQTQQHLGDIGLVSESLADTSFCLKIAPEKMEQAARAMGHIERGKGLIIVSPSRVTQRHMHKQGKDYESVLCTVTQELLDKGYAVAFLPHSLATGNSKNNDLDISHALLERLPAHQRLYFIDPPADAETLRAMFATADLAVTSRFHATVASLAMQVPPVVISWNFKYKELLQKFGLEDQVMEAQHFNSEEILRSIYNTLKNIKYIKQKLKSALPGVISEAERNFSMVASYLKKEYQNK